MPLVFTTIQHSFRKEHDLTFTEYVFLDMVYHLSNPECFASRETMASELGVTKRNILILIEKMVARSFLEKSESKKIRTSSKWNRVYIDIEATKRKKSGEKISPKTKNDGEKVSPKLVKKVPKDGEKVSPYNKEDINKDNNEGEPNVPLDPSQKLAEEKRIFLNTLYKFLSGKGITQDGKFYYPKNMVVEFAKYWLAVDTFSKKKVLAFKKETTFDLGGRLARWFSNLKGNPVRLSEFWDVDKSIDLIDELKKLL